jgi:ABC-2 type transport system permease protein
MSTAELTFRRPAIGLRLFASELSLTFRRRRNQALLVLLALVPVLVGIAIRLSSDDGQGAPDVIGQVAGNGVFLSAGAFFFVLPLFLPLAVSVVSGDTIAGEASTGTLRYLLAVPAGRTRLLAVKYASAVTFCVAAVAAIAVSGLITGIILFPVGPVTLLSGTTVSLGAGLARLALVALYVAAGISTLVAIGMAVSTLTDSSIAAITATAMLPVISQILDAVPQLSGIHPYLFTHWWTSYSDLLRDPMATGAVSHGLLAFLAYTAIFGSVAWSRFTTKDVTC